MQTHVSSAALHSYLPLKSHHSKNSHPSPQNSICCSLRKESKKSLKETWPSITISLFGSGFLVGTVLDGLHSRVGLQEFQNGAIQIGSLQTNIWVPPMLGAFYCTVGMLQLLLDERVPPVSKGQLGSPRAAALSFIALVLFIEFSAELFNAGVPSNIEAYALFALAELIWFFLDRTWSGFALACFIGVACPIVEIPFIKDFHLWSYPDADIQVFGVGLVSWTTTCYFVYTPFLVSLSRWLKSYMDDVAERDVKGLD